jgi:hypothetical protein
MNKEPNKLPAGLNFLHWMSYILVIWCLGGTVGFVWVKFFGSGQISWWILLVYVLCVIVNWQNCRKLTKLRKLYE